MLDHLFDNTLPPSESSRPLPTIDDLERRIHTLKSADPDPYGLHKLPMDLRLTYMEHYLITGNYLI